jgi:hypothetical protein
LLEDCPHAFSASKLSIPACLDISRVSLLGKRLLLCVYLLEYLPESVRAGDLESKKSPRNAGFFESKAKSIT